ncbi:MAG: hypothetical protein Q7S96_01795 [bacterium]|nr:hypothetical protein [bacterium]
MTRGLKIVSALCAFGALLFLGSTFLEQQEQPLTCTADACGEEPEPIVEAHARDRDGLLLSPSVTEQLDVLVMPHLRGMQDIHEDIVRKTAHLGWDGRWEFLDCDRIHAKSINSCVVMRAEALARIRRSDDSNNCYGLTGPRACTSVGDPRNTHELREVAYVRQYATESYRSYFDPENGVRSCTVDLDHSILKECSNSWDESGLQTSGSIYEPMPGALVNEYTCPAHAMVEIPRSLYRKQALAGRTQCCLSDEQIATAGDACPPPPPP